jgi:hypothetical protein
MIINLHICNSVGYILTLQCVIENKQKKIAYMRVRMYCIKKIVLFCSHIRTTFYI